MEACFPRRALLAHPKTRRPRQIWRRFGNDVLNGGAGDDRIFGGQGDGALRGGAGSEDILTRGSGADRFVFAQPINGQNSGADRITDFNAGEGGRLAPNEQGVGILGDVGGVALRLLGGGTVALGGIAASSVRGSWFA